MDVFIGKYSLFSKLDLISLNKMTIFSVFEQFLQEIYFVKKFTILYIDL
jgi:hypothetical protein